MILRLLRLAIRLLAPISPRLAGRWAYRLWFRTRRYPEPARERAWRESAQALAVEHRGRPLAVCAWGAGPNVLLLHGWNGRGAQLGAFMPALVTAGFRVVAIDAPGHGRSPGHETNIPEMNAAIQAVTQVCGPLRGVIGHSFGVVCALYAVREGLSVERIVAVAPPAEMRELARRFCAALNLPSSAQADFYGRLEARFGADLWDRFSPVALARQVDLPGLVIHDEDDGDVPWQDGEAVACAWHGAQFVRTVGLGHRRILRDPEVIAQVTTFISAEKMI
jgi:pimeloyl-ACP methyl ester carboxylesterase